MMNLIYSSYIQRKLKKLFFFLICFVLFVASILEIFITKKKLKQKYKITSRMCVKKIKVYNRNFTLKLIKLKYFSFIAWLGHTNVYSSVVTKKN